MLRPSAAPVPGRWRPSWWKGSDPTEGRWPARMVGRSEYQRPGPRPGCFPLRCSGLQAFRAAGPLRPALSLSTDRNQAIDKKKQVSGRTTMSMKVKFAYAAAIGALAVSAALSGPAAAQDKQPIKIGFSMAQTGPLGPNGQQALLGMKIWEDETNAKGGLLGRPVQLVYYDDQSNPSTVPGIYTKLLDVDKVDLVV